MQIMVLIGAYGRNYNTLDAALKDWEAGKDFKIVSGPYCSIRDMSAMKRQAVVIHLRYGAGNLDAHILHNAQMPDKLSGII